MEVKIYSKPITTTLTDKKTGEVKTITYDGVFLQLGSQTLQIKAVYKDDKKLLKYIVKECSKHEVVEEKPEVQD